MAEGELAGNNSWESWLGGWVQTAKEKSSSALEMVKKDLAEFTCTIQRDTEKAVEITKESLNKENTTHATNRVKAGLTSFLDNISRALVIPPDDDYIQMKVAPDGSGLYDRGKARLHAIQLDASTYMDTPEGTPEQYSMWLESFNMDEHKGEVSELLVTKVEVRALYTKLVPSEVSHAEFWQRYFYRVHQLQCDEARKQALMKRADQTKGDSFNWDDDDDDWSGAEDDEDTHSDWEKMPRPSQLLAAKVQQASTQQSEKEPSVEPQDVDKNAAHPISDSTAPLTPNEAAGSELELNGHIKDNVIENTLETNLPVFAASSAVSSNEGPKPENMSSIGSAEFDSFEEVQDASEDVEDASDKVQEASEEVQDASEEVQDASEEVQDASEEVQDASEEVQDASEEVQEEVQDASEEVQEEVQDASEEVQDASEDLYSRPELQMSSADLWSLHIPDDSACASHLGQDNEYLDSEVLEPGSSLDHHRQGQEFNDVSGDSDSCAAGGEVPSIADDKSAIAMADGASGTADIEPLPARQHPIFEPSSEGSAASVCVSEKPSATQTSEQDVSVPDIVSREEFAHKYEPNSETALAHSAEAEHQPASATFVTLHIELDSAIEIPKDNKVAAEISVSAISDKDNVSQQISTNNSTKESGAAPESLQLCQQSENLVPIIVETAVPSDATDGEEGKEMAMRLKGDMVVVGDRDSPLSSESTDMKELGLEEDWEQDFDIEITEEDLKTAESIAKQLGENISAGGDDDWENWE